MQEIICNSFYPWVYHKDIFFPNGSYEDCFKLLTQPKTFSSMLNTNYKFQVVNNVIQFIPDRIIDKSGSNTDLIVDRYLQVLFKGTKEELLEAITSIQIKYNQRDVNDKYGPENVNMDLMDSKDDIVIIPIIGSDMYLIGNEETKFIQPNVCLQYCTPCYSFVFNDDMLEKIVVLGIRETIVYIDTIYRREISSKNIDGSFYKYRYNYGRVKKYRKYCYTDKIQLNQLYGVSYLMACDFFESLIKNIPIESN